jgi:hypothetical protein
VSGGIEFAARHGRPTVRRGLTPEQRRAVLARSSVGEVCRPGRVSLAGGRRSGQETSGRWLVRWSPAAARQRDAILSLGGEPVMVGYEQDLCPERSRSNPSGRPVLTVLRVRAG